MGYVVDIQDPEAESAKPLTSLSDFNRVNISCSQTRSWTFQMTRAAGVIHKFLHVSSLRTVPVQLFGYPSQHDVLHMSHVHDGSNLAKF